MKGADGCSVHAQTLKEFNKSKQGSASFRRNAAAPSLRHVLKTRAMVTDRDPLSEEQGQLEEAEELQRRALKDRDLV